MPTLFLLSLAAFALTTAARGDPALIALQQDGQDPTPALLAEYRAKLGLDDPLPVRYVHWLSGVVHGDLGCSLLTNRPVAQMLGERIGPTLPLARTALIFSSLIGLVLGVVLASFRGSHAESTARSGLTMAASVPAFWLAITLIVVCGERLRILPVAGYGAWQRLLLPGLALSIGPIAAPARLTRGMVLEFGREDYVRAARAKGPTGSVIARRHVLRNTAAPRGALTGVRLGHFPGGDHRRVDLRLAGHGPGLAGGHFRTRSASDLWLCAHDRPAGHWRARPQRRGRRRFQPTIGPPALMRDWLRPGLRIVFVVAAVVGPFLSPADPDAVDLGEALRPPTANHPLGTDRLGRDVLARITFGGRAGLLIGHLGHGALGRVGSDGRRRRRIRRRHAGRGRGDAAGCVPDPTRSAGQARVARCTGHWRHHTGGGAGRRLLGDRRTSAAYNSTYRWTGWSSTTV